jgi:L-ascorbate 6-phosphate lactonase
MKSVLMHHLDAAGAALWWLGQAGYVVRAGDATVAIDPYLTNSAAANAPEFTLLFPPPIAPEELRADIRVITPDHLDRLDPEAFCWFCGQRGPGGGCVIARPVKPFVSS